MLVLGVNEFDLPVRLKGAKSSFFLPMDGLLGAC